jgi:hypothetical protein
MIFSEKQLELIESAFRNKLHVYQTNSATLDPARVEVVSIECEEIIAICREQLELPAVPSSSEFGKGFHRTT